MRSPLPNRATNKWLVAPHPFRGSARASGSTPQISHAWKPQGCAAPAELPRRTRARAFYRTTNRRRDRGSVRLLPNLHLQRVVFCSVPHCYRAIPSFVSFGLPVVSWARVAAQPPVRSLHCLLPAETPCASPSHSDATAHGCPRPGSSMTNLPDAQSLWLSVCAVSTSLQQR